MGSTVTAVPTGADAIAEELTRRGVTTVFCITGAGNLAIVDAIARLGTIDLIYTHHEQAAVMAAQGFARVTGGLGVALVTTGGGTSNAVTGVLSAHLDSIPVLVISGNESSFHCTNMKDFRAYGVQGFDSVAVMSPVCKSSMRVQSADACANAVACAIETALTPRRGPAHIDVPMDLQRRPLTAQSPEPSPVGATQISVRGADAHVIDGLADALRAARRPLIYVGNGARDNRAAELLATLIRTCALPYALSWSAIDLIHEDPKLDIGRIGIYGDRAANILLQQADLILCIGTRLAIPQTGYDQSDFARQAQRWVVDIDQMELSKFPADGWHTVEASAADVAEQLLERLQHVPAPLDEWLERIAYVKSRVPRATQAGAELDVPEGFVHSQAVIEYLNQALEPDAVIVTDVGAGLLTGHYAFEPSRGQRFFTSQGLGEMGFGLPGAIGAAVAARGRQVVCLSTDGGMMFNLQELETVRHSKLPIKLVIFNNDGYAMIRISQNNLFEGRLAGSNPATGVSFPDFRLVAEAFGFGFTRVSHAHQFATDVERALASPNPEVIEIVMSPAQRYLPRLATLRLPSGDLVSPPLEDLDPLIDIDLLTDLLGYQPRPESLRARGIDA